MANPACEIIFGQLAVTWELQPELRGVYTVPGWREYVVMPLPSSRRPNSRMNMTTASLGVAGMGILRNASLLKGSVPRPGKF